jgi:molecular chaperone GrpE (heat shock protein)
MYCCAPRVTAADEKNETEQRPRVVVDSGKRGEESREPHALAGAVRHEFDQVLPHIVAALKREDGVAELRRRLDLAEKRLADRGKRPLIRGLRQVLMLARTLDFETDPKEAITMELERVLIGAGYEEFGEAGEGFDPARHEALSGEAPTGAPIVTAVIEPGLETLGEVVVRAKIEVASEGGSR